MLLVLRLWREEIKHGKALTLTRPHVNHNPDPKSLNQREQGVSPGKKLLPSKVLLLTWSAAFFSFSKSVCSSSSFES